VSENWMVLWVKISTCSYEDYKLRKSEKVVRMKRKILCVYGEANVGICAVLILSKSDSDAFFCEWVSGHIEYDFI
jgi:hypothetical protein